MGMRERISMLTPAYKEAAMRSLALLALSLIAAAAFAQPSVRVRGAISAFDGKALAVKDAGGKSFDILLVDKTEIVFAKPIALAEIRAGDFLGVTSLMGSDGADIGTAVTRWPRWLDP